MGEDKIKKMNRLAVKEMVRGHDSTIAHSFEHSDGRCPKCSFNQQRIVFCNPGGRGGQPFVRLCELDGEHLHRMCGACGYRWVERCWDQAMLAEEQGKLSAESEAAAMLAAVAERHGGITMTKDVLYAHRGWIITFVRDAENDTVTITAEPPPASQGEIHHPQSPEDVVSP